MEIIDTANSHRFHQKYLFYQTPTFFFIDTIILLLFHYLLILLFRGKEKVSNCLELYFILSFIYNLSFHYFIPYMLSFFLFNNVIVFRFNSKYIGRYLSLVYRHKTGLVHRAQRISIKYSSLPIFKWLLARPPT